MNVKEVENLIRRIKEDFSNQEYQRISDDVNLESVPRKIWQYWYSDGQGSFAICNIDEYFIRVKQGDISIEKYYEKLSDLYDALAREFELLNKANLTKGE